MLDPTTLSSLKVTELKAELKKRGLPVGGLKQALVVRLADVLMKEQAPSDATAPEEEAAAAAPQEEEEEEEEEEESSQSNGHAPRAPTPTQEEEQESGVEEAVVAEVPEGVREPEPTPADDNQLPVEEREETEGDVALVEVQEVVQAQETPGTPGAGEENEVGAETDGSGERDAQEDLEPVLQEQKEAEEYKEPEEEEEEEEGEREQYQEAVHTEPEEKREREEQQEAEEHKELEGETEEHKEPEPVEETEEMEIDTAAEQIPKEATPAPIEPAKIEEATTDGDASMAEAPVPAGPPAPSELPAPVKAPHSPKAHPPTETQSAQAIAQEITTAITSQADLAAPPAASEPMDTDDPTTELRKRKRRSASPPPAASLPPAPASPRAEDSESGSISKRPRLPSPPPSKPRQRDARFKGLFNNNGDDATLTSPRLPAAAAAAAEDDYDPPVSPSLHPATRALYIRNLVRPINEPLLRQHLMTLAAGQSGAGEDQMIESFFVDAIKSHALVVFDSLTAATRVRVGLHGKVWPNERTRKPLWVEFVPEEKIAGWVETERKGGRWEVVFKADDDVEGGIRADLEEVGTGGRGAPPRGGRGAVDLLGAPTGPRGERERGGKNSVLAVSKSAPISTSTPDDKFKVAAAVRPAARVVDLDELFRSTRTKPKLYFMPVSEELARERLAAQGRDSRGRH